MAAIHIELMLVNSNGEAARLALLKAIQHYQSWVECVEDLSDDWSSTDAMDRLKRDLHISWIITSSAMLVSDSVTFQI